jgi:hypothetical protein
MLDLIAMLGQKAMASAAASPGMELGKQMMAGNVAGGLQGMAQSQIGPQMQFVQSLGDPNANSFDAFMKMQKEKKPQPAGMPQITQLEQPMMGPQGMQTQMRGMPIAQGLPQGLLQQIGYQR